MTVPRESQLLLDPVQFTYPKSLTLEVLAYTPDWIGTASGSDREHLSEPQMQAKAKQC